MSFYDHNQFSFLELLCSIWNRGGQGHQSGGIRRQRSGWRRTSMVCQWFSSLLHHRHHNYWYPQFLAFFPKMVAWVSTGFIGSMWYEYRWCFVQRKFDSPTVGLRPKKKVNWLGKRKNGKENSSLFRFQILCVNVEQNGRERKRGGWSLRLQKDFWIYLEIFFIFILFIFLLMYYVYRPRRCVRAVCDVVWTK